MSDKANIVSDARRSRRSMFKAAGVVFGALVASSAASKSAGAVDCFLRDTRIRTSRGYRRIETLSAGDLLPVRFGGVAPILKIKSYVVARGDVRPVRVARSALDDNVPAADLWLTAPHAIHIDGVLISIVNLVNGTTIAFDNDSGDEELEFFHIELANHDVIDSRMTWRRDIEVIGSLILSRLSKAGGDPSCPIAERYAERDDGQSWYLKAPAGPRILVGLLGVIPRGYGGSDGARVRRCIAGRVFRHRQATRPHGPA